MPIKIGPVGKKSTYNLQDNREFDSHYWCESFVGRRFVNTSVSVHKTLRSVLTLVSPWSSTHLNFYWPKKKFKIYMLKLGHYGDFLYMTLSFGNLFLII